MFPVVLVNTAPLVEPVAEAPQFVELKATPLAFQFVVPLLVLHPPEVFVFVTELAPLDSGIMIAMPSKNNRNRGITANIRSASENV
jgi:hypothetical protein